MLKFTSHIGRTFCILALLVVPAQAEDDPPENFRLEMSWELTADGAASGTEEATYVESATTKVVFFSGKKQSSSKDAPLLVTHTQRDADGSLRKYRRHKKVRKGSGVHAFRKADGIRIVGVNAKFTPVELPAATDALVWDPSVWHPLVLWVRSGVLSDQARVNVLDVETRSLRTITIQRAGARTLSNASGAAVQVERWRLQGLVDGGDVEIFVTSGRLRGVKQGVNAMLEKGWSWKAPEPSPAPVPAKPPAVEDTPPSPADSESPEPTPGSDPGEGP
jgi:hypothetical protein